VLFRSWMPAEVVRLEIQKVRVEITSLALTSGLAAQSQCKQHLARELVLQREEVCPLALERARPRVIARIACDELHRHANALSGRAHASLENGSDPEVARDPSYIGRLSLVGKRGCARGYPEVRNARQGVDELLCDAI